MPGRSSYTRPLGIVLPTSFDALSLSFHRALQANNKSPRTVQTYSEGLRLFGQFESGWSLSNHAVAHARGRGLSMDCPADHATSSPRSAASILIWLSGETHGICCAHACSRSGPAHRHGPALNTAAEEVSTCISWCVARRR